MDAYARGLRGYNNSNAPLQAAWGASKWPRAAELIKYYAQGPAPAPVWAPSHAQAFANMLTKVSVGVLPVSIPLWFALACAWRPLLTASVLFHSPSCSSP
jgi:hypothetical protein